MSKTTALFNLNIGEDSPRQSSRADPTFSAIPKQHVFTSVCLHREGKCECGVMEKT